MSNPSNPSPSHLDGFFEKNSLSKAGMVPYRRIGNQIEIALIHRLAQNDWSFPKGHREKDEGLLEAAARETEEETGLNLISICRLENMSYRDSHHEPVGLAMFLAYVPDKDGEMTGIEPQERGEWVALNRVEETLSYQNLKNYFRKSIAPHFEKKHTPGVLSIIYSKKESYFNGLQRLLATAEERGVHGNMIETEQLEVSRFRPKTDLVYFLTNDEGKEEWLEKLHERQIHIINKKSIGNKSANQKTMAALGISVPRLQTNERDTMTTDEWLNKSERHDDRSFSTTKKTYLEERIAGIDIREIKVTSLGGRLFTADPLPAWLHEKLKFLIRMHDHFHLDLFSADVLFSVAHPLYWVIDLNPAPALYQNAKAREAFALYARERLALGI